jgi:hypothetical protein
MRDNLCGGMAGSDLSRYHRKIKDTGVRRIQPPSHRTRRTRNKSIARSARKCLSRSRAAVSLTPRRPIGLNPARVGHGWVQYIRAGDKACLPCASPPSPLGPRTTQSNQAITTPMRSRYIRKGPISRLTSLRDRNPGADVSCNPERHAEEQDRKMGTQCLGQTAGLCFHPSGSRGVCLVLWGVFDIRMALLPRGGGAVGVLQGAHNQCH